MCWTGDAFLIDFYKFGFALTGINVQDPVICIRTYVASLYNAGNAAVVLLRTQLACVFLNIVRIQALITTLCIDAGLAMRQARVAGEFFIPKEKAIEAIGALTD